MSLREVIKLPNPVLRRKANKVTDFGPDMQILINDMVETMRNEPGVGLAAPQIGISLRLIVVEYPEDDSEEGSLPKLYAFANPEIQTKSRELVSGIEGCLSVPNLLGLVDRENEIIVSGFNRYGKKQSIHAHGWLARIFQHEIDHLNGVLFVDKASKLYQPEEIESGKKV